MLCYELLVGYSPFYKKGSSRMDMFKRIVRLQYQFPSCCKEGSATDFIRSLLQRKPADRLGNQANGYLDVKTHDWFSESNVSFKEILNKKAQAPWIPPEFDYHSMETFDDYTASGKDQDVDKGKRLTKDEQDLFVDF